MESEGQQQQRVDRWLSAISEARPAGENVRSDPAHENLRNAVANLEGLQVTPIDWSGFSSEAEQLLVARSKDLLIAGYLAYGLFQTEGLGGLANGLALMSGILERYWDDCFPEVARMRGRVNAVSWLVERATNRLQAMQLSDADRVAVPGLATQGERFSRAVSSRFDPGTVELEPLQQAIAQLRSGEAVNDGAAAVGASDGASPEPPEPTAGQAPSQDPTANPGPTGEVAQSPVPVDAVGARLAEIARPFVDAIPGERPAGENARYDQRHEAIRKEIEKLGKPSAGEADWQMVRDEGRALLAGTSKDYLIASYFAVASYAVEGPLGLVEGIVALSSLLEHYWDEGFPPPKRIRARINAIDWFIDRLEFVEQGVSKTLSGSDLPLLSRAGTEFEALVLSRFEEESPKVYRLREILERIKLSVAKHTPSEPKKTDDAPASERTASPRAAPAKVVHAPASTAPVTLTAPSIKKLDADNLDAFLEGIADALLEASSKLFQESPANPHAYRLARQGLYLHLTELPPTTGGNETYLSAPKWGRDERLTELLASQNWEALLRETEPSLPKELFWLDLHRYVALALGGLGHDDAREAVVAETTSMVRRLPGIMELEFKGGGSFASQETREWLAAAAPVGGGGGAPSLAVGEEQDGDFAQKLREAHQVARGGNLQEAIDMLNAAIASDATGGRDRFRAKLAMAGACAAARVHALAEGILAGLTDEIQRFQLEIWEPKLAEACYRARYEALMAIGTDGGKPHEELMNVYRQLCKVSPSAALSLKNPGAKG